jgi:hypothetical protein
MRGEAELGWRNRALAKLPLANLLLTKLSPVNLPLTNLSLAKLLNNNVGQVVNLRPIVNRPPAGPAKLLRRRSQSCRDWIHLNVLTNPLKLSLVANQPIIALILPKRLPGQSKHLIALTSRKSLKRLHHPANLNQGSHQEMNVIRHHNVGVELVMPQLPKVDGIDYHTRDLGNAKVERPGACDVENAVHSDERLAGGGCSGEVAIRRQTAVQAPRDEDRLADGMIVRKPAASKGSHVETVADPGKILRKVKRPIANRPQVTNLPHKAASRQSSQQGKAAKQACSQQQSCQLQNSHQAKQPARQSSQQAKQPKQPAGKAASMQSSQRQSVQQAYMQPAGLQPSMHAGSAKSNQRQWSLQVNAA